MVALSQLKAGVINYIDHEILPHMTGATKFGATIYLALVMENGEEKILEFMRKPSIAMLNLMDDNSNIDIDRLKTAALKAFEGNDRLDAEFPVVGRITFHRSDV